MAKSTALAKRDDGLAPSIFDVENFDELRERLQGISRSKMIPQAYQGKVEDIIVAVEMGRDVDLKPLQALQSIAVINGTPAVWGQGLLAIIQNSPVCEYIMLTYDAETKTAHCTCKRTSDPKEQVFSFSWQDAVSAGLAGRDTYKKYPMNMLRWRALALASKFAFPDVSKGLVVAEEAMDYPPPRAESTRADDLSERIRSKTIKEEVVEAKEVEVEEVGDVEDAVIVEDEPAPAKTDFDKGPLTELMSELNIKSAAAMDRTVRVVTGTDTKFDEIDRPLGVQIYRVLQFMKDNQINAVNLIKFSEGAGYELGNDKAVGVALQDMINQ